MNLRMYHKTALNVASTGGSYHLNLIDQQVFWVQLYVLYEIIIIFIIRNGVMFVLLSQEHIR